MTFKVFESPQEVVPSARKIMATVFFFWDSQGILLMYYLNHGNTVSAEYYESLLQDIAPVHKSRLSKTALTDCSFEEIEHPPYTPDSTWLQV